VEFLDEIDPNSRPQITGLSVTFQFLKAGKVLIGDSAAEDPRRRLQVDVIGPPGSTLLYNGVPVDPSVGTEWSKIHGALEDNEQLINAITAQGDLKVGLAPDTLDRWEVTKRDVWVKSLAQTRGTRSEVEYEHKIAPDRALLSHGAVFINKNEIDKAFSEAVSDAIGAGVILSVKLVIGYTTSAENSNGMYFSTDNPIFGRSRILNGHAADWEWSIPMIYNETKGGYERFNEIRVHAVSTIADGKPALAQANKIRLTFNVLEFEGVDVGAKGKELSLLSKSGDKRSIDINGTSLDEYFNERIAIEPWKWPERKTKAGEGK